MPDALTLHPFQHDVETAASYVEDADIGLERSLGAKRDGSGSHAPARPCRQTYVLLRRLGRDPDPAKSKDHVLLSVLAERRALQDQPADLPALLADLSEPPIQNIGALALDDFVTKSDRKGLAAALNTLLASPTFASWRQGTTLDIADWLKPQHGRTPGVIVNVAHLDDDERALVLGVLLEEILSWVRTLPGSQRLRALVVFDEVYGFLPSRPQNRPTKRPLVALMKPRAFGVGVVMATQNPMDLDYRALSNAGLGASDGCRRMPTEHGWWKACRACTPRAGIRKRSSPRC